MPQCAFGPCLVDAGWSASIGDAIWEATHNTTGGNTLLAEMPELWYTLFVIEVILECLLGLYLADLVSGIVHLCLDYEVGTNADLRRHAEFSIDNVKVFEAKDPLFKEAKKRDQYLWNFHVHHDAVWPAADPPFELFMQMFRPGSPYYIASVALACIGVLPPSFARFWLFGVAVGMITQFTHFGAHARHRNLIKGFPGAKLICFLQDHHILLHPETHRSHHIHFDRDFCILNGWANPVVNRLRKFGTCIGFWPKEAPTTTTRRERAELAGVEAGPTKVGHDGGLLDESLDGSAPVTPIKALLRA